MSSPAGREERQVLTAYLTRNRLKRSAQREAILDAFVKAGHHVSVEDLLEIVRRRHPDVGRTTIYRTLKLFKEAGLASELLFGGEARFEPVWNRDHHDHFVCVACGEIFEFRARRSSGSRRRSPPGSASRSRATGTTSSAGAGAARPARAASRGRRPPREDEARADRGPAGHAAAALPLRDLLRPHDRRSSSCSSRSPPTGSTGHAECVADVDPFYLPETNDTALHVLRDFLAPMAFSLEIAHPREVLPAFARVRGHEMAKAALEMAVWELWARREGVPLWTLLGGRGGEIAAGVSVGLQEDEAALLDKVEAEVAAGYRRVKVKIKPGRDLALVAAIRAPLPARCRSWWTPTARTRSPMPGTSPGSTASRSR